MTGPDRPSAGAPIPPGLALALAGATFVALAICALGVTSLLTDRDVIGVEGLGLLPGALGIVAAVLAFTASLWRPLRRRHPLYRSCLPAGVAVLLAYVVAVWFGALLVGAELGPAGAAAAGLVTGGFAPLVALAAVASGWFAILLVRGGSPTSRWPWESRDRE